MTYPTTWTFALDERTTHMSMTSGADFGSLVFAKPDTVDGVVASFVCTRATPPDVAALLDLAHKLLRTSVVHYEFAALAAENLFRRWNEHCACGLAQVTVRRSRS